MKKSVMFLINGLGVEKPGSYSISIDQCMPNLCRTKETSYFTTAVINSIEYRSAYESFFLGDTYKREISFIKEEILNEGVVNNPTYKDLSDKLSVSTAKLHVFLEPTNDQIVEAVNELVNRLNLAENKKVYLHLLLTQQTVNEYKKLITIVNYIKYHINSNITVGFIMGKELANKDFTKDEVDYMKKMFFFCSCERWTETDKKLISLQEANIRPCVAPGFCSDNNCNINNNDVILFFNTRSTNYDKLIKVILDNCEFAFKTSEYKLPLYSLIKLDTTYDIPFFCENIVYENSLANILARANKKALIITSQEHLTLVNFLANGLKYVNNPSIQFMKLDDNYLSNIQNIQNVIDMSPYELIIFDYHMDVSKTINDLKAQLERIDVVLGNVATVCENKHSLFITSLYGLKKDIPLAEYNAEIVTIDYEMQIPIFFFDYTYPRSKYTLAPGETNDILMTAIRCIWDNPELYSLIKLKGLFNNLFGNKK